MIAVGTRFFGKDKEKDLPRLKKFIDSAVALGRVYVAVNPEQDQTEAIDFIAREYASNPGVAVFPVTPWGKFVPALNAIVYKAAVDRADYLLLASAEFAPMADQVERLLRFMDGNTLVVGARFAEHEFHPGEGGVKGNGVTVPWSTFALWNMRYLAKLGFPLIGDAPFDPMKAGVEEVSTIAFYQRLSGGYMEPEAKLVRIPGLGGEWNMDGRDAQRIAKHNAKIQSKVDRPAAQLSWAELDPPVIIHIED